MTEILLKRRPSPQDHPSTFSLGYKPKVLSLACFAEKKVFPMTWSRVRSIKYDVLTKIYVNKFSNNKIVCEISIRLK